MKRAILAAALLFVAAPVMAATEQTVAIDNFVFAPAKLDVKAGTKVVFLNRDDSPHNVVLETLKKRSPLLDTGERFEITFDKPGDYAYFCGLHPQMTGHVVVTP
jgi:plastocyanin